MIDKLVTKNLILRKAREEDLQLIWKNIWRDKEIANYMLWQVTKTIDEAKARMERTIKYQNENYAYFVCLKDTDEPIGFAGVFLKEDETFEESGICIAKKYQGLGYGKEVVSALKDLIFSKLNGRKFIYGCFSTNEKSRKLCLSQGFKYLNSEYHIREHDNMCYVSDYYYIDKNMYEKEKSIKISKKIVAIGGGFNGRRKEDGTYDPYETGPMDQEIIRITGKEKPNFLFIAHTQDTEVAQDKYFVTMRNVYKTKYACECRHLKSKDLLDKEKVDDLIEWADIIYEGGGNTLDMIKLWKETGFDKILRKAWENGKVMCGVSAGANCWFKECSSDSLQIKYGKDQPLIDVECIGLIDGLFVPHCDEPGRADNVKDLLKTSSEIGLSISNCCALEIIDDEYRLITSTPIALDIKPYGLKTYWEDGEYITEKIDDSLEFKPLSELLSRNSKNKTL